jgi:hypothetical protein
MIDWETETWRVVMVLEHAASRLPDGDPDRELLERVSTALGRSTEQADEQSTEPTAPQAGLVPRQ